MFYSLPPSHLYSPIGVHGIQADCKEMQREENSLIITYQWAYLRW